MPNVSGVNWLEILQVASKGKSLYYFWQTLKVMLLQKSLLQPAAVFPLSLCGPDSALISDFSQRKCERRWLRAISRSACPA